MARTSERLKAMRTRADALSPPVSSTAWRGPAATEVFEQLPPPDCAVASAHSHVWRSQDQTRLEGATRGWPPKQRQCASACDAHQHLMARGREGSRLHEARDCSGGSSL